MRVRHLRPLLLLSSPALAAAESRPERKCAMRVTGILSMLKRKACLKALAAQGSPPPPLPPPPFAARGPSPPPQHVAAAVIVSDELDLSMSSART